MKPRSQSLVTMFPYRQNADGCPLCVICGTELRRKDGLARRKTSRYCSSPCCDEANIRAGITARIRELVFERDKGICAGCGLDCDKIKSAMDALAEWSPGIFRAVQAEIAVAWRELASGLKSKPSARGVTSAKTRSWRLAGWPRPAGQMALPFA